jgi:hypothetical protein
MRASEPSGRERTTRLERKQSGTRLSVFLSFASAFAAFQAVAQGKEKGREREREKEGGERDRKRLFFLHLLPLPVFFSRTFFYFVSPLFCPF